MLVEFAHLRAAELPGNGQRTHLLKPAMSRWPEFACPSRSIRGAQDCPILSHWSFRILFVKLRHRAANDVAPRAETRQGDRRFLPQSAPRSRSSRPLPFGAVLAFRASVPRGEPFPATRPTAAGRNRFRRRLRDSPNYRSDSRQGGVSCAAPGDRRTEVSTL